MQSLLEILLEARLDLKGKLLQVVAKSDIPISIKHKGKWIKGVTVTSTEKRGKDEYIKADVKDTSGNVTQQEFKVKDITDWGEVEFRKKQISATYADQRAKRKKAFAAIPKPKKKRPSYAVAPTSNVAKKIIDLIENNRAIRIYYDRGLREDKPGWRVILPVAYGAKTVGEGKREYLRAWQWSGKTVRGVPKWKLFRVDKITNWDDNYSPVVKNVPDPRYNPAGDKWMDELYMNALFEYKKPKKKKKRTLKEELDSFIKDILKS